MRPVLLSVGIWLTVALPASAQQPQLRATLRGHGDVVYSVAFSPDGKALAAACGDNTIQLWDLPGQ